MKISGFKLAKIFGVLLILTSLVLMFINPRAENNLPQGFFTPIIAFEFLQDTTSVQQLFQVDDVVVYKQAFNLGNQIDFAFMFIYSFFLLSIAIGIYQRKQSKAMYIVYILCILIILFDALENIQLFQITNLHPNKNFETPLAFLQLFTWLKWSSIASVFLIFAPYFFQQKWFGKFIGLLQIICPILLVVAYFNYGIMNEIFALSVVLNFLCLVIFIFSYKKIIH